MTTSICMMCENAFISNGLYKTCSKCHGPCDTFRYVNYTVDQNFYDATQHNWQKDENTFGYPRDNSQDLPFRRRVPKPEPSTSRTLKKSQTSDQFRVFGYRILNLCSRYEYYAFHFFSLILNWSIRSGTPIPLRGWECYEILRANTISRREGIAKRKRKTSAMQNRMEKVTKSLCK